MYNLKMTDLKMAEKKWLWTSAVNLLNRNGHFHRIHHKLTLPNNLINFYLETLDHTEEQKPRNASSWYMKLYDLIYLQCFFERERARSSRKLKLSRTEVLF